MSVIPFGTDSPPVLGPDSAGLLMTPEEFDEITDYEDGFRYELIRGVLVVTPVPSELPGFELPLARLLAVADRWV